MISPGAIAAQAASVTEAATFVAPGDIRHLSVGGQTLLFSQSRQQIFSLNETADFIWRRLAAGQVVEDVARALEAVGAPRDQALEFVISSARTWLQGGQLLSRQALAALESPPRAVRAVAIDELNLELRFHGDADPAECDPVFGQFYQGAPTDPARRLDLVRHGDLVTLFLDGQPCGASGPAGLTPLIKAQLTQLYVDAVQDGFLAHGAYLVRGERFLFLSGQPGAGKTTLTAALTGSGWAYGGDDIVRIQPDGRALGAPFSAAVKSGAWGLAQRFAPEIEHLPTVLRGDGQLVRYWRPARLAERKLRSFGAVVLLDRQAGARAQLTAVDPVLALSTILESAYASKGRLDADALQALARGLESAGCYRFTYSDLDEAVAAIGQLSDV